MTATDRAEAGRALRRGVPRSAHGDWSASANRRAPIEVLEEQGLTRLPELAPVRYGRMATSPFAFFRGSAAVMAMDLAATPTTGLRVQACGDAHVANFGKFATPERNLVFDLNDFDETLPGPWEWDVKRLAASLYIVARERGFSPSSCAQVVAAACGTYRDRLRRAAPMQTLELWYERIEVGDVLAHFPARYRANVRRDIRRARRRDHARAIAKLTTRVNGRRRFLENPPLLVHLEDTENDWYEVAPVLMQYRATLRDDRQVLLDRFRVVDIARKVVGVGSVGTRCWVALLEGRDNPQDDCIIIQVKEAQASVLEPYAGASTFDHHGRRVVAGQRLTQAASDMFLGWAEGPNTGHQYYLRQMWDAKGSSDTTRMSLGNLTYYGTLCAWALARSHARTGDPVAISNYLGRGNQFDRALARFARSYCATNAGDHAALVDAIAAGRVKARTEL